MTSNGTTAQETISTQGTRMTGRVKWFNNTSGYGFITVTDGEQVGNDIFVHHSVIIVKSEQYKYLVQGEYVMFSVANTSGGKYSVQAVDVSGINGGKLMCETRRDFKDSRNEYVADKETSEPVKMPRSTPTPSVAKKTDEAWTYNTKQGGRGSSSGRGLASGRGRGVTTGRGRGARS